MFSALLGRCAMHARGHSSRCLELSLRARRRLCTPTHSADMEAQRLCFIGGGKMAECLINRVCAKNEVSVLDVNLKRCEHLAREYQLRSFADMNAEASEALRSSDMVVLAVKPQNTASVFETVAPLLTQDTLVVSVIAGLQLGEIEKGMRTRFAVRSMPNTPAMVQEGMTVWTASAEVSERQKQLTRVLLRSCGKERFVQEEDMIDMATAISGTGPAYVFMIMEAMIEAAVHMGMPRDMAQEVVLQTIKGSTEYARESMQHPVILKNDITSPGGTTAAALYTLEQGNFRTVMSDAMWAAYRRSRELGDKDTEVGPLTTR